MGCLNSISMWLLWCSGMFLGCCYVVAMVLWLVFRVLLFGSREYWVQTLTGHWEHRDVSRWPGPGGWFGPLPCVFIFFIFFIFCLPNVPKWSYPIVTLSNKSIINHKSVSLDWQRRALRLFLASVKRFWTESMRGTRGRRGNGQKKQLNVVKLLTCSGLQVQVSFICNTLL